MADHDIVVVGASNAVMKAAGGLFLMSGAVLGRIAGANAAGA